MRPSDHAKARLARMHLMDRAALAEYRGFSFDVWLDEERSDLNWELEEVSEKELNAIYYLVWKNTRRNGR